MECERARDGLWPPEKPKLCADAVLAAQEHVEACADCQAFFAQDRELLDAYHRFKAVRAPREVRERVFDVLARERAGAAAADILRSEARVGRGRRLQVAGLVAASIASALAVGWFSRAPGGMGQDGIVEVGSVFVEDYLRRAVAEEHIISSSPEEISRFLTRELGRPMAPLDIPGLDVERAEICLVEGRRGAMIVYKQDGREISHYLIPREEAVEREPATSPALEEAFKGDGMPTVVTWATTDMEQALVGAVPAERLVRLAGRGRE